MPAGILGGWFSCRKENVVEEERLLSESESIIMRAVWDSEEDISIPDLTAVLKEKYGKEYARTTVVTFLLKLSDKRFARTYRKGKLSYVTQLVSQEEYRKILTKNLLRDWYRGDADSLVEDVKSF